MSFVKPCPPHNSREEAEGRKWRGTSAVQREYTTDPLSVKRGSMMPGLGPVLGGPKTVMVPCRSLVAAVEVEPPLGSRPLMSEATCSSSSFTWASCCTLLAPAELFLTDPETSTRGHAPSNLLKSGCAFIRIKWHLQINTAWRNRPASGNVGATC